MQPATVKLYEDDPYRTVFIARVVGVAGDVVELDQTSFYPGGGGQDPDGGTIAGLPVREVQRKGGVIRHTVPGHALSVGQEVEGKVDWPKRIDLMRAHTGEHLLFSALNRLVPDLELVKIAITPTRKSFMIRGAVDWEIVLKAETMVNQVIQSNVQTEDVHVTKDDPLVADSRVKLDRIPGDQVRLVRIGDFDLAACAGVHVRRTGEIGMLLVEKLTSAKPAGDYEIEFKVGEEAVGRSLFLATIAQQAAELRGSHPEDLLASMRNQEDELVRTKDSLRRYAQSWLAGLSAEMIGEVHLYAATTHGLDRKTLSEEATKRVATEGGVCILVDESDRTLIVVAVSKDLLGIDANGLLQSMIRDLGGKGGGNRSFASGGMSGSGQGAIMLQRGRSFILSAVSKT